MTTDPFTETANAAAREYARTPRMNVGTVQDRIGEAHADGWEAARAHLATQEPTDAEVEAAARVIHEHFPRKYMDEFGFVRNARWEDLEPHMQEEYRVIARAALIRARAARRDEEKRDG